MNKVGGVYAIKPLIKLLLSSFVGAFLGAGWLAYTIIQLGAPVQVWIPLSAVGAMTVCGMMLAVSRPYFHEHILHH